MSGKQKQLLTWGARGTGIVVLGVLWVMFTTIMTGAIALGLLWAIMALGVYITYRTLDIADLSVEGTITLGAAMTARIIAGGGNPWLATVAALLVGLLAGLCTGLLHTKLKISALLSGILTMTALYSINLRLLGGSQVPLLKVETVYTPLEGLLPSGFAPLVVGLIFAGAVAALLYWFFGTELGSSIRATGSNPNMVRAQGINTNTMKILGLMISNGLVGLSGALIAQYQAYANVQMGIGSIVIGLASLIIGEVLFGTKSFKRTLLAVIMGAIIYRIIIALVLKANMNSNDLKLFVAITVALALALPVFKSHLLARRHAAALDGKEGD